MKINKKTLKQKQQKTNIKINLNIFIYKNSIYESSTFNKSHMNVSCFKLI